MTISSIASSLDSSLNSSLFSSVVDWDNLWLAWRKAAKGKRGKPAAAAFELQVADHLLQLQDELRDRSYRPSPYTHFYIHEPKRRKISAAPFRDRVVHHALCNVIEPIFDARFIRDSFANRRGKGTHRAIDRLQQCARRYPYVLRLDIVKHFPSLDHPVLLNAIEQVIGDGDILWLVETILASGVGVLTDEYDPGYFPGDDLFALARPRGLPIGNLTSQFWSNVYMNALDWFVVGELGCPAYLRYVDDFALFADSKAQLWRWKEAIVSFLQKLRLTIHDAAAQVQPIAHGIPWLGFVVYPTHRRLKARNAVKFTRRLARNIADFRRGRISFAELDASVQGWIAHVAYADTWGLRRNIFGKLPIAEG